MSHRSDEAEADVHSRIEAIQQNEIDQIRVLGSFLDNELNYAKQYTQILRDVKDNWPGTYVLSSFFTLSDPDCQSHRQEIAKLMELRRPIGPMHDFSRERAESPRPKIRSRASSKARARSRSPSPGSTDSDVDDELPPPRSRKGSTGSMRSRKRSDSQTTTGSAVEAARDRKEKEEKKKGSWSVWGRNGSKRDRDQFTSLRGGADDESDSSDPERAPGSPTQVSRSASLLSLGKWSKSQQNNSTPRIPALGTRARGREQEKVVRATSDYLGSSDELSFRTGDEIVVIGEVIDGWMMGQLDGKKGLFPTVYTEPISGASRRSRSKPSAAPTTHPLLRRKSSSKMGSDGATDSLSGSRQTLVDTDVSASPRLGPRTALAQVADTDGDYVDDSSHPFGDHHATTQDTDQEQGQSSNAALGSGYRYSYDSESLAESAADESEHERSSLVRRRASDDDGFVLRNNPTSNSSSSGPPKKVPPPLPRRQTDVRKAPPPPPPPRRPDVRASPRPPTFGLQDGQTGDCANFLQAVGRATGMCANCQRMHIA